MNNYFSKVDGKVLRMIRLIGREADRMGMSAYVVGGNVRDILIKRRSFDLDVVVEGDAICLARVLAKPLNARVTVHRSFGTASLALPSGSRYDLAMTRRETYRYSGALPTVSPGTLKEDLLRRDFTINAMALAINRDRFGQLTDICGGLKDLATKKIRILHEQSFIDDPTRIARAVRFEQRFGFQIERRTLILLKECINKKITKNVKCQRHFNELKKILCESDPDPVSSLKRLHRLGWIPAIPTGSKIYFANLRRIHDRIQRLKMKPWYRKFKQWWMIYLMGLMERFNENELNDTLTIVHFTKNERQSILQSKNIHGLYWSLAKKYLPASRVYQRLKLLNNEVIVYLRVRTSRAVIMQRIDRFLCKDIAVRLKINGDDLKKMGMYPGRSIGKVLEQMLYWKIDHQIRTKADELKQVQRCFVQGQNEGF
jgi:tRNA nucleotidyltransferase (CCA-adding enzyme)